MKTFVLSLLLSIGSFLFAENSNNATVSISPLEEKTPPYVEITDESHLSILSQDLQDQQIAKLQLPNGLCVYLISDPKASQDAAALGVHVGSWNDPEHYPGMAHFLEHMLFQGTAAYPEPESYMRFIWDHGGCPNAFTADDRTVYMFSINHSSFTEALDRFSHFFIDPLFHTSQMENELFAVDQEYGKNIENDDWRKYQIWKETGNPFHPNARFSIGNSKTLGGIPKEELKKWYETYYSANLMDLVVYSSFPLDTLKEMVCEKFKKIPNHNVPLLQISDPLSSPQQKGHMTYISPIQKKQQLTLQWELPHSLLKDESKAPDLIGYILTRGNSKSLLEYLKTEGLAENMEVQNQRIGFLYHLFSIEISLTEKGVQNVKKVIQSTFEAIALLKETPLPVFLFDEMKSMREITYHYQGRELPFSFVKQHATQLLDEDLSTYPRKTLLPSHFDLDALSQTLAALSPKECTYYLLAPSSLTQIESKKKETWLGGEYTIEEIPQEDLLSWEKAKPSLEIQLPTPNSLIPNDLSILPASSETKEDLMCEKFVDDETGKAFFLLQNNFKNPSIAWDFFLQSPEMNGSTSSLILLDLYLTMLDYKLQPLLLCGFQSGFFSHVNHDARKVELLLQGFSEKAPIFLKELLEGLKSASFTQEDFDRSYLIMKKCYENGLLDLPMLQAKELQSSLVSPSSLKTSKEKARVLKEITFDKFQEFHKKFLASLYVEACFAGNMTKSQAEEDWKTLKNILAAAPYPPSQHVQKEVLLLSSTKKPVEIIQPTEALGSGVVLTLGQGDFSFSTRSSQQILIAALREAFFTALRSKQKTAYIAQCWEEEIERQLFLSFAVQSSSHEIFDLLYRFEFFIEDFAQNITTYIPEHRFHALQQDLITQLSVPPKNLLELVERQSKLAFEYDEDFAWFKKRIQATEELSYKDFVSFVKTTFSFQNKGRIALLVKGKLLQEENVSYSLASLEELLKTSHYVTPASKKQNEALSSKEDIFQEEKSK